MIKPEIWHDQKQGWCCRVVVNGLRRTFSDLSSRAAAEKVGELQLQQLVQRGDVYTQRELQQLGFCGAPGSYEIALERRRAKFGVVLADGKIKRLL